MIRIRKAEDRGRARFGWLDSRHSFSFGYYHDPDHMGYGHLRVINDDRVAPGGGFETHGHRDMEIISVVLEGAMEHKDSAGFGGVIGPGDVQRMSAGSGIMHSEFNRSKDDALRFLQIWIVPERKRLEPGYEQKRFEKEARLDRLCLVGSRDGREDSVTIHQDVSLYASSLSVGATVDHEIPSGRRAWLQVANGTVELMDTRLGEGDGAAIEEEDRIALTGVTTADVLLFDLA